MRAVFMRKEPRIEADPFVVEKLIVLSEQEYLHFTKHLMDSYDFIEKNTELMWEENGIWHCILVTGEGTDEGVLVESEGSSYARYAALVPSVAGILQQINQDSNMEEVKEENGQAMNI